MQLTQISTAVPHIETPLADFMPASEEKVLEILKTCQPKSCELDPIPTSLLLESNDSLLPLLESAFSFEAVGKSCSISTNRTPEQE